MTYGIAYKNQLLIIKIKIKKVMQKILLEKPWLFITSPSSLSKKKPTWLAKSIVLQSWMDDIELNNEVTRS